MSGLSADNNKGQSEASKKHASPSHTANANLPSSTVATPLPATPPIASTPQSSVAPPRKEVSFSLEEHALQKQDRQEHLGQLTQFLISHMQANRQEFSEDELAKVLVESKKKCNEKTKRQLFENLKTSKKIKFSSLARGGKGTFTYQSTFVAKTIHDILSQLQQYPDYRITGIEVSVLNDAYENAKEDIAELMKDRNKVLIVHNDSSKTDVLYPNDPNCNIKVDNHLKDLWRSIEVPQDVATKLEKSGIGVFKTFEWEADKEKRILEEKKEQGMAKKKRTGKRSSRAPKSNEHVQEIDFTTPYRKE